MTFKEFHNGIRILLNVDKHVLVRLFGQEYADEKWVAYRADPHDFFIRMPGEMAQKLYDEVFPS